MFGLLQLLVIIACIIFCVYVFTLVSKNRLLLKYSLMWLFLACFIVFFAVFPEPIYALSKLAGFDVPSNFIFIMGLFFLMSITLSLSAIASKQTLSIKNLTQRLAIVENELFDLKGELTTQPDEREHEN